MPQLGLAIHKHRFLDALEKSLKENNEILYGWYSVEEKNGLLYEKGMDVLFTGTVKFTDSEHKTNRVIQYVNGLMDGFFLHWGLGDELQSEYFYVKDKQHGRCLDWDGQPYEGRIRYDRNFEHGKCLSEKAYNLDGTFRETFFDS